MTDGTRDGAARPLPTSEWAKLACWLLVIPGGVFFGSPAATPAALVVLLASSLVVRAPLRRLARTVVRYMVPLGLVFGLILIVTRPVNEALFREWMLTVGRFGALLGFGSLFSLTTTPLELVQGLRRVGIPQSFAMGLMAAYRTVPLLSERMEAIVAAQRARGAMWRSANPLRLARLLLSLAVPAVYATTDIAIALADSLHVRGYRATRRMSVPREPFLRAGDLVLLALSAAVVGAAAVPFT